MSTQQPFNFFNQPPPKLTTAQLWLAHVLEVTFIAAAVAAGITVYGAFVSGNHDWTVIGGLALAAAIAVGAKAWSTSIQNNANLMPAIMDYAHNILSFVSQAPTQIPIPVQPQGPLIVQHITQLPEPPVQSPSPITLTPGHALQTAVPPPVQAAPIPPAQITLTPTPTAETALPLSLSPFTPFSLPQRSVPFTKWQPLSISDMASQPMITDPASMMPAVSTQPPQEWQAVSSLLNTTAPVPPLPVNAVSVNPPPVEEEPVYYVAPLATPSVASSAVPERVWDSAVLKAVTPGQ